MEVEVGRRRIHVHGDGDGDGDGGFLNYMFVPIYYLWKYSHRCGSRYLKVFELGKLCYKTLQAGQPFGHGPAPRFQPANPEKLTYHLITKRKTCIKTATRLHPSD